MLNRKQTKRIIALLKAEQELGREFPASVEVPEGFKESFEAQPDFRGWVHYHVNWDVDAEDHMKVVPLSVGRVAAWDREVEKRTPVILPDGRIVTADEYRQMESERLAEEEKAAVADRKATKAREDEERAYRREVQADREKKLGFLKRGKKRK
jgi:hypothetical protein